MLPLAALGFILWMVVLLWRINTKTAAMPVKGEESSTHCGLPAAEEAAQTLHPGKHSLSTVPTTSTHSVTNRPLAEGTTAGLEVKRGRSERSQSSEGNSESLSLPRTSRVPMLSSGPEARERLKFILGASEDNSSDEEPLVTKPPSGAPQPPSSTSQPSPEQPSSAGPQTSSSSIK